MSVVDFEPLVYHTYLFSPESALQNPSDGMSSFDAWQMGSWYENCEPCMIMDECQLKLAAQVDHYTNASVDRNRKQVNRHFRAPYTLKVDGREAHTCCVCEGC